MARLHSSKLETANIRRNVVLALLVLLGSPHPANSAVSTSTYAGNAAGVAGSIWEAAKSGAEGLWTASSSLLATPDPFEYVPEQMPNRDRRFVALMEAIGYRLTVIDTQEGLFGRVSYRFEQQRAPSPDDFQRLRRGLVDHHSHHSGAVASAERRALRGLLAVATATSFRVAIVSLELLPWPKVGFHLVRRENFAQSGP